MRHILPRRNHSLPMLVIVTWLGRSASYTLPTGLFAITTNFPPLTFCTRVRGGDSLCRSMRCRFRRFWGFLLGLIQTLNCAEVSTVLLRALGRRKRLIVAGREIRDIHVVNILLSAPEIWGLICTDILRPVSRLLPPPLETPSGIEDTEGVLASRNSSRLILGKTDFQRLRCYCTSL